MELPGQAPWNCRDRPADRTGVEYKTTIKPAGGSFAAEVELAVAVQVAPQIKKGFAFGQTPSCLRAVNHADRLVAEQNRKLVVIIDDSRPFSKKKRGHPLNLLIETTQANLRLTMQWLNVSYAACYNKNISLLSDIRILFKISGWRFYFLPILAQGCFG